MSRQTPLRERHVAAGAKLVEFAGWELPVQYAGILDEHQAVRTHCGVFDISHMGEFFVRGEGAARWLDSLLTNRLAKLEVGEAQYTLLLNEAGGVIDDLIVYRTLPEEFLLIVNAARIAEDFAWLESHRSSAPDDFRAAVELIDGSGDYAAIAVQGPEAPAVFAKALAPAKWEPRRNRVMELTSGPALGRVFAARTGYTGETGFEMVVPAAEAENYWDRVVAAGARPCGLGARDTLRLEMGYPLNGADLSGAHTPLEAGLGIFVDLEKGPFVGREALLLQKENGLPMRLAGIRAEGKSPPFRPHYPVCADGRQVGETTSGALSPSLNCGIAMAYLPFALAIVGRPLEIEIRGRRYPASIARKPFYQPLR